MESVNHKRGALYVLVSVFFFWGFVAAGNDILIPVFKKSLKLEQWQAQLISFCFYVAYTVGSLLYFLLSKYLFKQDILNKIGYKNGLVAGLLISAFGALLFQPAAMYESFELMLTGLFVVGLGFSLQQTAANPMAIRMGDPDTGSQRLSLAGGVNNIGTTIAPVLISLAIFGVAKVDESFVLSLNNVKLPYIILCAALVLVAIIIKFSPLPNEVNSNVPLDSINEIDGPNEAKDVFNLKNHPGLAFGMLAIFVYVGVEVSTAANLGEYLHIAYNIPDNKIAPYVALFWASLMIGRWTSAADAFSKVKSTRRILSFCLPLLAFTLFLAIVKLVYGNVSEFYIYLIPIAILMLANYFSKGKPTNQLAIYSGLAILCLIIGIFGGGVLSIFALIAVGLFCSTLWPCIFDLAINDLGVHTSKGSGLLIMMIMGGGFISVIQGWLADDKLLGIRHSYWVGVLCFIYLIFYASFMKKAKKNKATVPASKA